jgi:deoxyribodipyrimidine photo-lyase
VNLVWFKRDLRTRDHAPLVEAAKGGPVLPLYIVEPSLLRAEDFSPRHWTFLQATLIELRENLTRLGQPLIVRVGEAVEILRNLREQHRFQRIWSMKKPETR